MNTKISKNLLCMAISLILVMCSCLPVAFAANVGSPIKINVSEVPDSDKVSNGGEGTALYMAGEHYVEFTFNITNHAMYDISIYQRSFECDVELYVDGFLKATKHVDTPGDAWQGPSEVVSLGKVELKPGERKIKIRVAPDHPGTLYMMDCILQETDDEIVGTTDYTYHVGGSDMANTNVPDDGSRRYGDGREGNWGWSMSGDEYVTFNITLEQETLYDLYVLGGGDTTTLSAELDGEYLGEGVSPICDWKIAQSTYIGTYTLSEGKHALKINVVGCEENISGYNLKRIFITQHNEDEIVAKTEYTYNVGNSDMANTNVPDDGSRRYGDGKEGNWGWSMSGDEYVTFNIALEQEAFYDLYVLGGGDTTTLSAELDGEYLGEGVSPICDWKIAQSTHIGTYTLPKGKHALKINVVGCEENISGYNLKRIFIKKYEEIDVETINAGNAPLPNGGFIKVNTDVINIEFSSNLSENIILEDCFVLSDANGTIPLDITVADNKVQLALKKTFEDNSSYTLDIIDVEDKAGISSISKSYNFDTFSYGVENNADITDFTGSFENNKFTANGRVVSSVNKGIAGRKVLVSMYYPSNKIEPLTECNTISGENGAFNISYELPSDTNENGKFIMMISTEYSGTRKNVEGMFFTEEGKKLLEEAFLETKTAEDVYEFLSQYQTALFVDLNMISNLSEDEQNILYESFAGYSEPLGQFCDKWEKRVALANIVYADDESDACRVLYDKDKCEVIGVDFSKIKSIETYKASLTEEILKIEKPSELNYDVEKKIVDEINKITDKWVIKEFGKSDNALISNDDKVYIGQNASFELELEKEEADAKEIILVVNSDDSDIAKSVLFFGEGKIKSNISYDDNKAIITLDTALESKVTKLGKLQISPPAKQGEYTISVYGETVHNIDEIDFVLKTAIEKNEFSAIVEKQAERPQGGGAASSSSTGKGSSGSSVIKPEKPDEPTVEDKDVVYTDVDSVEWAKEAICYLADINILSKPEDKLFRPNDNVTREEFTKMVVNAMGLYDAEAETQLKDVEKEAWYYTYVASAEKEGIILGNEEGLFNIGANITRQDMAVIINRVLEKAGYQDKAIGNVFADDNDISGYAKKAVYNMLARNIINGVGDDMFAPKSNATRAQAAKIIYEMLKVVGA